MKETHSCGNCRWSKERGPGAVPEMDCLALFSEKSYTTLSANDFRVAKITWGMVGLSYD